MSTNHRSLLLAAALGAFTLIPADAPHAALVLPRPSPAASTKQTIGNTDLTITYSRPGVKGRVIWGGLEAYGKPWRTGANEPNNFTTTDDIKVGGKKLAAGSYSILTIPAVGDWTVIFSSQKGLMGSSNYDPKDDALRLTIKPDTSAAHQEWLWFGFDELTPNSAHLVLRWQRLKLAIPLEVDVNTLVLADARTEIAAAKPDDWRVPYSAARWSFDNNVALPEGSGWLDKSLGIQKTHANLNLKARWLHKDGKKAEAIATAKEAIAAGKASKETVDTSATEKLVADWTK
ncbi:MAG: DUF2911 domain-containing protein [Candidatus Eisenbacteria bacterium]